jgi:hypothetical protein
MGEQGIKSVEQGDNSAEQVFRSGLAGIADPEFLHI